ncbi:MAG: RNase P modulator RnpM [bacterium]
MSRVKGAMSKREPVRTCIGCGQKRFKGELVRIVRTPDKTLEIDWNAKKPGRGAYLCPDLRCVEAARKHKRILVHLKLEPPMSFFDELRKALHGRNRKGA